MPPGTPGRAQGASGAVRDTALVLTAGLGTRLRPLSHTRAKPAVPIAGEALVRRVARWLASQDVRSLVLNLHYRPETITAEVGDGSDLGVKVRYSWEVPILGSAGGPRKALPLMDAEEFFVINGDTLTDVDLRRLAEAHARSGALVTLAVIRNLWPDRYGGIITDDEGIVRAFVPRGFREPSWHFVGVQLVHRSVFAHLPAEEPAESIGGVYTALLAEHPDSVRAVASEARFWDVGTPRDYLEMALAFSRAEGQPSLPIGRGSRLGPSSRLIDTAIWDDVEVGAGVELIRCVVGDGVRIPDGSRFEDCAIAPAAGFTPTETERIVGNLLVAEMARRHDD